MNNKSHETERAQEEKKLHCAGARSASRCSLEGVKIKKNYFVVNISLCNDGVINQSEQLENKLTSRASQNMLTKHKTAAENDKDQQGTIVP